MSKILIIENTPLTALRLKMELEKEGYAVTGTVGSATAAIDAIQADKPDLVLLDYHLDNDENGGQVAEYINANTSIPIIYLSQYTDPEVAQHIDQTHFYAYLTKPFKTQALLLTVKRALSAPTQPSVFASSNISFTADHKEHIVPADNILWISTKPGIKGTFITTKHKEDQFRVYSTLKELKASNDAAYLVQISSSCILNLKMITAVIGKEYFVIGSDALPTERATHLDEPDGTRRFKIGRTYKRCFSSWEHLWRKS